MSQSMDEIVSTFDAMQLRQQDVSGRPVLLLVCGPLGSGTTTFILTLTGFELYIDHTKTGQETAPLDVGRLTLAENLMIWLFSVAGQQRFEDWRVSLLERASKLEPSGLVLLVDSTKPETFHEAQDILNRLRGYWKTTTIPAVIAVNKQDLTDAFSVDDLRGIFSEDAQTHLIPCVATDHASAVQVLVALLRMIVNNISDT